MGKEYESATESPREKHRRKSQSAVHYHLIMSKKPGRYHQIELSSKNTLD